MIRIFKTRTFVAAFKKVDIADTLLVTAVQELSQSLHDGDLGGGLYKKRLAVGGKGKRGSVRTIVATRAGERWFYLYGFKKNERADITPREQAALKALARDLLGLKEEELQTALRDGAIWEIDHGTR